MSRRIEDALPRVSTTRSAAAKPWFVAEAELATSLLSRPQRRASQPPGQPSAAPLPPHRADTWLTSRLTTAATEPVQHAAPPAPAQRRPPQVPPAVRHAQPKVSRARPPFQFEAGPSAGGAYDEDQVEATTSSRAAHQAAGVTAWAITPPRKGAQAASSQHAGQQQAGHHPVNQLRVAAPPRAGVLTFDLSDGDGAVVPPEAPQPPQSFPQPAVAHWEQEAAAAAADGGDEEEAAEHEAEASSGAVASLQHPTTPSRQAVAHPAASPPPGAAGAATAAIGLTRASPGRRASPAGSPQHSVASSVPVSAGPTHVGRRGRTAPPVTSVTAPSGALGRAIGRSHDAVSASARRYAPAQPAAVRSGAVLRTSGPVWQEDSVSAAAQQQRRRSSGTAAAPAQHDPASLAASLKAWRSMQRGEGWFALDGSSNGGVAVPPSPAPVVEETPVEAAASPLVEEELEGHAGEGSPVPSSDGYCVDDAAAEVFEDAVSEAGEDAVVPPPVVAAPPIVIPLVQPTPLLPPAPAMPPVVVVVPAPAPAPAPPPKKKAPTRKQQPVPPPPPPPPSSAWWIELGGDVALPPDVRRKRVKRPIKPKMYPLRRRGEGRHAVLEVDPIAAAEAVEAAAAEEGGDGGMLLPSPSDTSSPSSSSDDSVFYGMEGDIAERTGARGPGQRSGRTASRLLRRTDAGVGGGGAKVRRSASGGRAGRVRSAAPPDTTNLREAASKRLSASASATNRALAGRLAVADARARGRAAALDGARTLPGTAPQASSWLRASSVAMPMFKHKIWDAFLPSAAARRFTEVRGLLVPRDDPVVLPGDEAVLEQAGVIKKPRRASVASTAASGDGSQGNNIEGDNEGEVPVPSATRRVRVPLRPDWSWGFWRAAAEAKAKAGGDEGGKKARPDVVLVPSGPVPGTGLAAGGPGGEWLLRGRPAYGPHYNGNDLLALRNGSEPVQEEPDTQPRAAAPLPRHAVKALAWTAGEDVPDPVTLTVTGGHTSGAAGAGVRVKMGAVRSRSSGPPQPAPPPALPGGSRGGGPASPLPRRPAVLAAAPAASAAAPPAAAYVVVQPSMPQAPPVLVPLAQAYPPLAFTHSLYPGYPYPFMAPAYATAVPGSGADVAAAAVAAATAALQSLGGGYALPGAGLTVPAAATTAAAAAAGAVPAAPTAGVPSTAAAAAEGGEQHPEDRRDTAGSVEGGAGASDAEDDDDDDDEEDAKVAASPLYVRSLATGRIVSSAGGRGGKASPARSTSTPSRSAHPIAALRSPSSEAGRYDSDDPYAPNAMEERLAYRRAEKKWQRQRRAERGEGRDSSARALASSSSPAATPAKRGTSPAASATPGKAAPASSSFGGSLLSPPPARRTAEDEDDDALFAKLRHQMIGSGAAASSGQGAATPTKAAAGTPVKAPGTPSARGHATAAATAPAPALLPPTSPVAAVSASAPGSSFKNTRFSGTSSPAPPPSRGPVAPPTAGFTPATQDDDDDRFIDAARVAVLSPSKAKK